MSQLLHAALQHPGYCLMTAVALAVFVFWLKSIAAYRPNEDGRDEL